MSMFVKLLWNSSDYTMFCDIFSNILSKLSQRLLCVNTNRKHCIHINTETYILQVCSTQDNKLKKKKKVSFICKSTLPLLLRGTLLPVHFICSPTGHLLAAHLEQSPLEHRKPFLHEHFVFVVNVQFSAYTVGEKEMEPQPRVSQLIFRRRNVMQPPLSWNASSYQWFFHLTLFTRATLCTSVEQVGLFCKVSIRTLAALSFLSGCADVFPKCP